MSGANPILDEKYVSLVTFRKSGVGVPSPVWIARVDSNSGVFTTDFDSGKIKRIANNSKVTIQACDMRGRVKADSPVIEATAARIDGADADAAKAAIGKKYGLMAKMIGLGSFFSKLFRRPQKPPCGVRITIG